MKAAIDRQSAPTPLPSAVATQVTQWSTSEDAWALTTVPPSTLRPRTDPKVPGLNGQGPFQAVQSAAGGVKFGNTIVIKVQAQADNAQDATSMAVWAGDG